MSVTPESSERDPVEMLAEEYFARQRRGERPTVDEYADRHPAMAERIRRLFPTLALLEEFVPPAPPGPPDGLGEFRVLRELGRGGMGVVYEAVQEPLGRHVALKVLTWHGRIDAAHLERFRLEASSAARLHHTNIVPVFGVGEDEGVHYYSMQFIHGTGLDVVLGDLRRLRDEVPAIGRAPDRGEALTVSVAVAHGLLSGPAAGTPITFGEAT